MVKKQEMNTKKRSTGTQLENTPENMSSILFLLLSEAGKTDNATLQ